MTDEERTLEKCLNEIAAIRSQPMVQSAKEIQTLYGLRATANPMSKSLQVSGRIIIINK